MSSTKPVYTQSLLLAAYQASAQELLEALAASGHEHIRHKHGAVFANLDDDGTRPSVLAERAGMTRAAMGELVDELELLGYVERVPDPADRRAKLVLGTASARDVLSTVVAVNERLERRFKRELGATAYDALRAGLLRLGGTRVLRQPRVRP
jgi:DNA-binding MarR family transcriptional regulator